MISEVVDMKSFGVIMRVFDVIVFLLRIFFKMYNGNLVKIYGKVIVCMGKFLLNFYVFMCLNLNILFEVIFVV